MADSEADFNARLLLALADIIKTKPGSYV